MLACPRENIGIRCELQIDIDAPVLLDFLLSLLDGSEIADCGRHDRQIGLREMLLHRVEHLLRGGDVNRINAAGSAQCDRAGYQRHIRAHIACLLGDRIAHFPVE